jgi:hypothetical protein
MSASRMSVGNKNSESLNVDAECNTAVTTATLNFYNDNAFQLTVKRRSL